MLTILVGPAASGRTAISTWIANKLAATDGERVLIVSDEKMVTRRWLSNHAVESVFIITSREFFEAWPSGVPACETFTTVIFDLFVLRGEQQIERLTQLALDMTTQVYLFLPVAASAIKDLRAVTMNVVGGPWDELVRIAYRAFRLNKVNGVVTLTAHKNNLSGALLPLPERFIITSARTIEEVAPKPPMSSGGLIARQLLEVAFENFVPVGVAVVMPVLRQHLTHGFPESVTNDPHWDPVLLLRLDPATYDRMNVEFHEHHVSFNLSFDRLYKVEVPYEAITQVAVSLEVVLPEVPTAPKKGGFVPRLVTDEEH